MKDIIINAEVTAREILQKGLSPKLTFHNLEHTQRVVTACQEIGESVCISDDEQEIILIAAWFHDTGYTKTYFGHEEASKMIALQFLMQYENDLQKIRQILTCIEATRKDITPKHITEKIICDADAFHLSSDRYFECLSLLRKEWELVLDSKVSDKQWYRQNLKFLQHHSYYTSYGKTVLERRKQKNLEENLRKIMMMNDRSADSNGHV